MLCFYQCQADPFLIHVHLFEVADLMWNSKSALGSVNLRAIGLWRSSVLMESIGLMISPPWVLRSPWRWWLLGQKLSCLESHIITGDTIDELQNNAELKERHNEVWQINAKWFSPRVITKNPGDKNLCFLNFKSCHPFNFLFLNTWYWRFK